MESPSCHAALILRKDQFWKRERENTDLYRVRNQKAVAHITVKVLVPGRHCSKPIKGFQNADKPHSPLNHSLENAEDNTPTSVCSQETSLYRSLSCQNVTAKQLSRSRAPLSGISKCLCCLTPGGRNVRQLWILTPSSSLDDKQAHTPTQQFQFLLCSRSLQTAAFVCKMF